MIYTFSCDGRSKFIPAITEAFREQRKTLASGGQIVVHLDAEKEGYSGVFEITITQGTRLCTVNIKNTNKTRFPARIKAAARALCQEGVEGTYTISHKSGELTITKV